MDSVVSKTISLFEYLQELSLAKVNNITDIDDYEWNTVLADYDSEYDNVYCANQDSYLEDDTIADSDIILKISCPEFEACPVPETRVKAWLKPGWEYFKTDDVIYEYQLLHDENDNETKIILSETRDYEYCQKWLEKRKEWQDKQQVIENVREIYSAFYQIHLRLERDKDLIELVVGNGIFCDKINNFVKHPLLLHTLVTEFDADAKIITVKNDASDSEFYNELFSEMPDINRVAIKNAIDTLKETDIHPLEKKQVKNYLKLFMNTLSTDSIFYEEEPEAHVNEQYYCYLQPVIFIRKKPDGAVKTINSIVEDLEEKGIVPEHIGQLVHGGQVEVNSTTHTQTVDEVLAETSGEDIDIYLAKEANKEQLEIAQKIAKHTGVLVQGPPGTGKTHTIANLLGHFLAQGKSVLVTSHTTKALSVLKDKVVPEIQPLCVSIVGDTNKEMERSIDGITDYIGRHNSTEIAGDMKKIRQRRLDVIEKLADTRRNIFSIMMDENKTLSYNGESFSLSEMANFVNVNSEELSYIPGPVELYKPLPLTLDKLRFLYSSNSKISKYDEQELNTDLPNENELILPTDVKNVWENIEKEETIISSITGKHNWKYSNEANSDSVNIIDNDFNITVPNISVIKKSDCLKRIYSIENLDKWMLSIIVDGKNDGVPRAKWEKLIKAIEECCDFSENLSLRIFGNIIEYSGIEANQYIATLEKLAQIFKEDGSVSWLTKLLDSKVKDVLNNIRINGKQLSSEEDCRLIIDDILLREKRKILGNYWDQAFSTLGVKTYKELNNAEPEQEAKLICTEIKRLLDWHKTELEPLLDYLKELGVAVDNIIKHGIMDSEIVKLESTLDMLRTKILDIIKVCCSICTLNNLNKMSNKYQEVFTLGNRVNSIQCRNAAYALGEMDYTAYVQAYQQLKDLINKCDTLSARKKLLEEINLVAPAWSDAIANRVGIHGSTTLPENIVEAWKWRQFNSIVAEHTKSSFDELQDECVRLSKDYRVLTAQYAAKSAWWNLLYMTEGDLDLKQALQGWKANVKKIGKGTGKLAYTYRRAAKKLMAKCQRAVPAWIMPVNKALELLDPKENKFDIVIIDEASQSDVTALAVLYMGKKVIVVGDDKQVSPMAIGIDKTKMLAMIGDHLSGIPNANLYTADTSLYGIAMTTYQPLMLKEHFRCVPEIIGFSNMLSYDYKIKPLRDVSKCNLLPYVVSYRVHNGKRAETRNINIEEAKTIVALIIACIKNPAYDGKTFGVITLLGSEQADYILQLLISQIDISEVDKRKIICGNASHFQGDERDVIFLSMVDSNDGEGPLRLMGEGIEESNKKRYNVAMSRAKDQVWIVHSLDKDNDLKSGDLRKTLLDYAENPKAFIERGEKAELMSESPFEEAVAKKLLSRGYHLEQQVPVGSYRIDMVAYYGEKRIAIECDGDRYHSGADKVIEDMERQTILERLGWRFIRIRGSEYYRHPKETMSKVEEMLASYGILPETIDVASNSVDNYELLDNVKIEAAKILDSWDNVETPKEQTKRRGGFGFKKKPNFRKQNMQ